MININPKKSLGQHFLTNPQVAKKIVASGNISPQDKILEIGPGQGFLTNFLLTTGATVLAIEKDPRAIDFLKEKFSLAIKEKKLIIRQEDILYSSIANIEEYKLIANIPYYLTGKIVKKFITPKGPKLIVLLIQKEVAERIIARNNKESIISLAIKIYGQAQKISTVKAGNFYPKPQVDSAIILIKKRDKALNINSDKLLETIKKGFEHKRKKLSTNLEIDPEILVKIGLDKNIRAEDLKLNDWINLS